MFKSSVFRVSLCRVIRVQVSLCVEQLYFVLSISQPVATAYVELHDLPVMLTHPNDYVALRLTHIPSSCPQSP